MQLKSNDSYRSAPTKQNQENDVLGDMDSALNGLLHENTYPPTHFSREGSGKIDLNALPDHDDDDYEPTSVGSLSPVSTEHTQSRQQREQTEISSLDPKKWKQLIKDIQTNPEAPQAQDLVRHQHSPSQDTLNFIPDQVDEATAMVNVQSIQNNLWNPQPTQAQTPVPPTQSSLPKTAALPSPAAKSEPSNNWWDQVAHTLPGTSQGQTLAEKVPQALSSHHISVDKTPTTPPPSPQYTKYTESLLLLRLDIQAFQGDQQHRRGQRLIALGQVKAGIKKHIKEYTLSLLQEHEDRLIVHSTEGVQGLRNLLDVVQIGKQLTQQNTSNHLRSQIQAVITSSLPQQSASRGFERAELMLLKLTEHGLWLDPASHSQLQQELQTQELRFAGLEQPVYAVSLGAPHNSGEFEIKPTTFIGRQRELAQLQQSWRETRSQTPRFALILGESGSGRTRLVEHWAEEIGRAHQFWAGADWHTSQKTHAPYASSLFHSHLQKHQFAAQEDLYQHLTQLAKQQHPADWQEYAATLLSLYHQNTVNERECEEAIEWYIRLAASHSATLVVFDDLHLMERSGKRIAERLLHNPPPHLFLILITARGEYEELFYSISSKAKHLELPPLTPSESRAFLRQQWPQGLEWRDGQVDKFVEESEGNPKLLLDMLKGSVKQTASNNETWIKDAPITSALEEQLIRRIRGLSNLEQDTLRKAAIIGETFWRGTIESLERMEIPSGDWGLREGIAVSNVEDRSDSLKTLEQKQLIERCPPTELGEEAYTFQQKALREVLLQQLPMAFRRKTHRRVAEWLLLRKEHKEIVPTLVEQLRLSGETEKAAVFLVELAQRSLKKSDTIQALQQYGDALELLSEESSSQRLELLTKLAECYYHVGDIAATIHLCERGLQLSWQLSGAWWGGRLYTLLADCQLHRKQVVKAEDAYLGGQALSTKAKDQEGLFRAIYGPIRLALMQSQPEKAKRLLDELKRTEHSPKTAEQKVHAASTEAWLARLQGRWADATNILDQATKLCHPQKQDLLKSHLLSQRGELHLTVGDEETARTLLWEAADIQRKHQAYRQLIPTLLHFGHTALLRREGQAAVKALREAWKLVQNTGEEQLITQIASALSAAYVLNQKTQEALQFSHIADQKLPKKLTTTEQAQAFYFLGEAAAGLPSKRAETMVKHLPPKLPEGGLTSFFFIRALDFFEKHHEKGRYILSVLGLSRALTAHGLERPAKHILERGIKDAERYGLGLLLERLKSQQRLLSNPSYTPPPEYNAGKKRESTMLVRTPRNKKK
tara:strand:+ start:10511 stop:14353 length:3843 start_codon:yes stop_codon:yes gene_type:complete